MLIQARAVAILAVLTAAAWAQGAERAYHTSVSDPEVEDGVKGATYNKGHQSYFGGSKKSDCGCCNGNAEVVSVPAASSGSGPRVKYILDGKPVYEEGTAPAPTPPNAGKPKSSSMKATDADLRLAVELLGTSGWRDAQAKLVGNGKTAVPVLIDALANSGAAYNLGGHTKADAGRASRQRTISEVSAELLADIVGNHSSYQGEVPAADQNAWRAWWSKNGESVTFAD